MFDAGLLPDWSYASTLIQKHEPHDPHIEGQEGMEVEVAADAADAADVDEEEASPSDDDDLHSHAEDAWPSTGEDMILLIVESNIVGYVASGLGSNACSLSLQ